MTEVRYAALDDLEVLVELSRRFCEVDGHPFDEARVRVAMSGLLEAPEMGFVLVAANDDDITGYAVVTWGYSIESGGRDALLDEIYAESPGGGVGSALLAQALRFATEGGASRMFLETEASNRRARAFYLRHGFHIEDSVWLSREL